MNANNRKLSDYILRNFGPYNHWKPKIQIQSKLSVNRFTSLCFTFRNPYTTPNPTGADPEPTTETTDSKKKSK